MKLFLFSIALLFGSTFGSRAQESPHFLKGMNNTDDQNVQIKKISEYLSSNYESLNLLIDDVKTWEITDDYFSPNGKIRHVYLRQTIDGIGVYNGVANITLNDEDSVVFVASNFLGNLRQRYDANYSKSINPKKAVAMAARHLNIEGSAGNKLTAPGPNRYRFEKGDLSLNAIDVCYGMWDNGEEVRPCYIVSIQELSGDHWWQLFVDVETGDEIHRIDWVKSCAFAANRESISADDHLHVSSPLLMNPPPPGTDQYNVFPFPVESPNHGTSSLVVGPYNSNASPFGWHDDDGIAGAEYTITRGNNVFAYEDMNDNNVPGFSPDGGVNLDFNFPINLNQEPSAYQSSAITNLFYINNRLHDILYEYGFDEPSGNFQSINYTGSGADQDYVIAEAQDGGGTNNANFATPPDGNSPRMQMYLWNSSNSVGNYLDVNAPSGIAGSYFATDATFGPGLPSSPITADVVLIEDIISPINDGCDSVTNNNQLSGKIVLIDRGGCNFTLKVEKAQNGGALAVIIVNNVAGAPIQMGGTSNTINIPSIMISQNDGNTLKAELAGNTVNATISDGGVTSSTNTRDSDFDNGIIAHEYGHGLSVRLTGGASNSSCLFNPEQMGEGWSDWLGLMLTMEPGDQGVDIRGVGTYAMNQAPTGVGMRPAPYSTDFVVNAYTYGDVADVLNVSEPHGIGFVWCTMLWDLTWAFINQYGFDVNIETGTGGNNMVLQLVIEAMKLQPCYPGFVDGRDAILQADQLLYNGFNQCLIWETFANRGLGYSASQGSSQSRSDQVEAFDLPPICQTPTIPPTAFFTPSNLTSCLPTISFNDSSYNIPQSWLWDFGDGNTDTIQNPTHTYSSSGTYTVKLTVTNNVGSDSTTQEITINLPNIPVTPDIEVCAGDTAFVITSVTGTAHWSDTTNNIIHTGDTLIVPNVGVEQTYYVKNVVGNPEQFIGPVNGDIGAGGYHFSNFHGALNFTANQSFEIVSAWLNANGAGPRTITLANGTNNGIDPGVGISQVTLNLVDGPQRVDLNLTVPAPGNYNIGGNNVDLFRNNSGANYPYTVSGMMTINNSSATTNPTEFYYYLYDIEIREPQCISIQDTVTITPISSNFNYVDNGGTVNFTDASSGAVSWFWDFGDGNISTLENPNHTYMQSGTYTVVLIVNGNCSVSYDVEVEVNEVGLNELNSELLDIALYPNPAENETKIVFKEALTNETALKIFSLNGVLLSEQILQSGTLEATVSLKGIARQLCYIVVCSNQGEHRLKLIVN